MQQTLQHRTAAKAVSMKSPPTIISSLLYTGQRPTSTSH